MKLSKSKLQRLKQFFAKQKDLAAVYLYGSFAKDTTHKGSDIDFGVLFDPPIKTYYRLGEVMNGLSDLNLPAKPDVRDVTLDMSPVYLRNVIQGKLVYSRNEIARIRFEVAAIKIFRDTEYLRRISYDYMNRRFKEGTYGFRQSYTV